MKRGAIHKKFYVYVLKELLPLFFLSLALFTFVLVLSRLGKMADLVVNKGVSLADILLLIVYSSPPFLAFTLPMAFLLSSVVALGRLSGENEILALKASGIDLKHLFVPISILGLAVFFTGFLNNGLLLGRSSEAFRNTLLDIAKKSISIEDKEGVFNDSMIPGVVIYVDKINIGNKSLAGIVISDDRDEGIRQTITAETGTVNTDLETLDLTFRLKNGSLQRWERRADAYSMLSFKDQSFSLNLASVLPNKEGRKRPMEMGIRELRQAIFNANSVKRYDLTLELYKRFSVPFSIVALILLTVPLGIKRKTEGKLSGVVYSLLIFIAYYMLSAGADNIGKSYGAWPLLVCFIPNVVFSAVGLYLVTGLNSEYRGGVFGGLRRFRGLCVAKTK